MLCLSNMLKNAFDMGLNDCNYHTFFFFFIKTFHPSIQLMLARVIRYNNSAPDSDISVGTMTSNCYITVFSPQFLGLTLDLQRLASITITGTFMVVKLRMRSNSKTIST